LKQGATGRKMRDFLLFHAACYDCPVTWRRKSWNIHGLLRELSRKLADDEPFVDIRRNVLRRVLDQ